MAVFYTTLATINFTLVTHEVLTTPLPFWITVARVSGIMGILNFNLALLDLISPLFQLTLSYLHIGAFTTALHKLHLHRNTGFYSVIFVLIHIVAHGINGLFVSPFYDGKNIYSFSRPAMVTGVVLVILLAIIVFFTFKIRNAINVHVGISIMFCVVLANHGFQHLTGTPIGDYLTLTVVSVSLALTILFRITNPSVDLSVNPNECKLWDPQNGSSKLVLLVLSNDHLLRTSGTYFVSKGHFLSSGCTFAAFSTDPQRLCFYFELSENDSFSHKLCEGVFDGTVTHLHVSGPFHTTSASLLQYLTKNKYQKIKLYLCAQGVGITGVSSLLQYFVRNMQWFTNLNISVILDYETPGMDNNGIAEGQDYSTNSGDFLDNLRRLTGLPIRIHNHKQDERKAIKIETNGNVTIYQLALTSESSPELVYATDSIDAANKMTDSTIKSTGLTVLYYCGTSETQDKSRYDHVFTETI